MGETTAVENGVESEKMANGVEHSSDRDGESEPADKTEKDARGGPSSELQQLLKDAHDFSLSAKNRMRESTGIVLWFILMGIMGVQLVRYWEYGTLLGTAIAAFIGLMGADILTGVVHWTFDTWGDTSTPVFGKTAILLFREHHVIPQAFTHRDFITTWGEPCLIACGILGIPVALTMAVPDAVLSVAYYFYIWLFVFSSFGTGHNQIHKWAHMTQYPVPVVVRWLQNWHLLLSKEHHHVHHKPPHLVHYCLVTGLPNYPLDYFKVWRGLEWLIEHTTSLKARADDMKSD